MRTLRAALPLLLVVGCGGPAQMIRTEPSRPDKPGWLNAPLRERGYVYVVGTKTRGKTLEEAKEAAHQNAAAQVSSYVGAQIRSQFEATSSTYSGDEVRDYVETHTAAFVKSLEQRDLYYEKTTRTVGSYYEESYDVWVLERFPLSAAEEERKRQAAEQAELARDALERFEQAQAEEKAGRRREAWILLTAAKNQLTKLPPATELGSGARFATVADLGRALDPALRHLDELAHGIHLKFAPGRPEVRKIESALRTELASALAASPLRLIAEDARFLLTLELTTSMSKDKTFGQKVAYVSYTASVDDGWGGAAFPGASGEAKGFGKSDEGAIGNAVRDAAQQIAKRISTELAKAVAAETSP